MSMNKIKDIALETTASYQALSQLGVQFWNQDRQTAILQFQITRNNYPLALSEENVKVFVALESGDSFLVDDNLDFLDELNGVVSYTIPDNFMRVAKSVVGQVYVTTLDEEEVVVQRKFSFDVANDLIASLPAEDKIREIKYFSDMRAEVAQMMEKLNNDFANMNDYVTQVQQTTEDGIESLTAMIDLKEKAYNDNHIAKMKELNDKGTEYSNKFDSDKAYMDEKSQAFKDSVNSSGVVTTSQTSGWQKYKFISDSGNSTPVSLGNDLSKLRELKPGLYYTTATPITGASSTAGFTLVEQRDSAVKRITFKPYNSNQIWVKRLYNTWNDWERIDTPQTDTGWVPFSIINGGRTNTAYGYGGSRNGYGCSYRVVTTGNKIEKHVRVNADSIVDGQVIAQLPNNFTSSPQIAFVRAPKDHNGTSIILENTGELKVYVANVTQWTATSDKYIYGNMYWVE